MIRCSNCNLHPNNIIKIETNKKFKNYYLNSMIILKKGHFITYAKYDNKWFLYDGDRAKEGFKILELSNFNKEDDYVDIYATSNGESNIMFDYQKTTSTLARARATARIGSVTVATCKHNR